MIFPRIKRGAQRSFLLLGQKCQQFAEKPALNAALAARKVAMHLLVARLVTAPIPMHGDIAHAAVSGDDADPSVGIPLNVAGTFSITGSPLASDELFVPTGYALAAVQVGTSYHDEAALKAAEDARIAAEAAAKQAREQAAAQKAKTAPKQLASNEGAAAARANSPKLSHDLQTRINYLKPYFKEEFGKDWQIAMAIGMAESGLTADSVSRTNDHGLMQINKGFQIYGTAIYDPIENLRIAARTFYKRRGFQPWTTYNKGTYKKFMHLFNESN
jgi:hypothetical protein